MLPFLLTCKNVIFCRHAHWYDVFLKVNALVQFEQGNVKTLLSIRVIEVRVNVYLSYIPINERDCFCVGDSKSQVKLFLVLSEK